MSKIKALLCRFLCSMALLLAVWLASGQSAWAQSAPPAAPSKAYVTQYFLVVVAIGLGLMVVCRPGKRADQPMVGGKGLE